MSDLYDDAMVKAALTAAWGDENFPHAEGDMRDALDAVAPLIAAKALRDLAEAADNNRLVVLDGGSSYIDLARRADEIERGAS